jgi:hypothetical protein
MRYGRRFRPGLQDKPLDGERPAARSLAVGRGTVDPRMPNVQGKVLGPGRSLTTLLDNRATGEAREDIRRQLRRSLECLVGVHFTEGNAITVLRNGDEIFPAMLEAIRTAHCRPHDLCVLAGLARSAIRGRAV